MKTRNIPSTCFINPTFSKCSWVNLHVCATVGHKNFFTEGHGQGWEVWILRRVRTFSGLGTFLSQHLVSRDEEQEDGSLATGAAGCPFTLFLFLWTQGLPLEFWLIIPKFLHVFMTKCTVIFDFCEGRSPCKVTQPPPIPGGITMLSSFLGYLLIPRWCICTY